VYKKFDLLSCFGARAQYSCLFKMDICVVISSNHNQKKVYKKLPCWGDWVSGYYFFSYLKSIFSRWYLLNEIRKKCIKSCLVEVIGCPGNFCFLSFKIDCRVVTLFRQNQNKVYKKVDPLLWLGAQTLFFPLI